MKRAMLIATIVACGAGAALAQGPRVKLKLRYTPGNYVVNVTDANGVTSGFIPVIGPNPTEDSNGHVNPYALTLPAGITDMSVDFGYEAGIVSGSYTINGTTF